MGDAETVTAELLLEAASLMEGGGIADYMGSGELLDAASFLAEQSSGGAESDEVASATLARQLQPLCTELVGLTNLRDLSPPQWCYELHSDPAACNGAYIDYEEEGTGRTVVSACFYDDSVSRCKGREAVFCGL